MSINLNVQPYNDDFDAKKNYQKILFVPGRNVQARELTQIQSIIQNQLKQSSDFLLKNGTVVFPGEVFFNPKVIYVELTATTRGVTTDNIISELEGKEISSSSGVVARVIKVQQSTPTTAPVVFLRYVASSPTSSATTFTIGEELAVVDKSDVIVTCNSDTKYGALCSINEGIFYIDGYFVQVPKHDYIVSLTTNYSGFIGLKLKEEIVTASDDPTLYDLSDGFQNVSSPGADRLKISLSLFSYDSLDNIDDTKFINLIKVKNGSLVYKENVTRLGEVEKVLARRTYDESGNYIVNKFSVTPTETRSNNRGAWLANEAYLKGDVVSKQISGKTYLFQALDEGYSGVTFPDHISGIASDGSIDWLETKTPFINNGQVTPAAGITLKGHSVLDGLGSIEVSKGRAYIDGFEVDKLDSTVIQFAKPRSEVQVNDKSIEGSSGMWYAVTDVVGIPNFAEYEILTIKNCNGTTVGTCRCRGFEILDAGSTGTTYALYVFDVVYNDTSYETAWKSFSSAGFSANAYTEWAAVPGTSTAALSGATTINTRNTIFTQWKSLNKFKIGNVIVNVTSYVDDDELSVSATSGAITENSQIYEAVHIKYGLHDYAMVSPDKFISTFYQENGKPKNEYVVRRLYEFTTGAGETSHVINLTPSGNEQFFGLANLYRTVLASNGAPAGTYAISPYSVTISGLTQNSSYRTFVAVKKSGVKAKEKTKVLKYKTIELNTTNQVVKNEFALGEADIYKLHSVTMSGGQEVNFNNRDEVKAYVSENETDITNQFKLDNGQRPTFYGQGKITKINTSLVNKPIKINFSYFDHTDGDFFTVDSYVDLSYRDIPTYQGIRLADVIDFRPRISDDGTGYTTSGASICEPLSMQDWLKTSYKIYDKQAVYVNLDSSGKFIQKTINTFSKKGIPSTDFTVARLLMDPYQGNVSDNSMIIQYPDHRRYTMSDIAKIDQRVENLEDYVSATLLEKQVIDMSITDKYGNDRYKSGFYVDPFDGHGVGMTTHQDYKCAMREGQNTLYPRWNGTSVKLIEKNANNRRTQNYQVTGNMVTLPYTTVSAIEQPQASRAEYVNPYMVWKFMGKMNVYPERDVWFDTATLPTVFVETGREQAEALARTTAPITTWGGWSKVGESQSGQLPVPTQTFTQPAPTPAPTDFAGAGAGFVSGVGTGTATQNLGVGVFRDSDGTRINADTPARTMTPMSLEAFATVGAAVPADTTRDRWEAAASAAAMISANNSLLSGAARDRIDGLSTAGIIEAIISEPSLTTEEINRWMAANGV